MIVYHGSYCEVKYPNCIVNQEIIDKYLSYKECKVV